MGRTQKTYERLDKLEQEFRDRLVKQLQACFAGNCELLFLAQELRPSDWPLNLRHDMTDELLMDGDRILGLRRKLGKPTESCLAHRFREACLRWADQRDPHRLGARRLAEHLLNEIDTTVRDRWAGEPLP